MAALFPIISVLVLFGIIMLIFTQEKMDYVAYSLLAAVITVFITSMYFHTSFDEFLQHVEFEPIMFIISMQIIVKIMEEQNIFQWIAIKTLHLTKGNHRLFFYLISILSCLSAAILSDITVAIIFVPLVIRACRILKIKPAPYLFGITFTINIGSIYTPFSSSENILIAHAFDLNLFWFLKSFSLFILPVLLFTLFLIDITVLRKESPPPEIQKTILLEIMNPNLVIIDKKRFLMNIFLFASIIIGFALYPKAYVVAVIGALLMILLNRIHFSKIITEIDWSVIFFFVALFLMIGAMEINGTFAIISTWVISIISDNIFLASVMILVLTSFLSGFLDNIPVSLIFISLIENIYGSTPPYLILIAFLLGVNLGANILPQGAACKLLALNLASKNNIEGYNYKIVLKKGFIYAMMHIVLCMVYLFIFSLILS